MDLVFVLTVGQTITLNGGAVGTSIQNGKGHFNQMSVFDAYMRSG